MLLKNITAYVSRGITPKYVANGGYCVLNQKCIRNGRIDFSPARQTFLTDLQISSEKCLQVNDILICSTGQGTLGRVAQIKEINQITTVDSHLTILRIDNPKFDTRYIGYYLISKQNEIEMLAEGSTGQTELSKDKLLNSFNIPEISISTQQHIVDTTRTLVLKSLLLFLPGLCLRQ